LKPWGSKLVTLAQEVRSICAKFVLKIF
jgi:hypothetical protein